MTEPTSESWATVCQNCGAPLAGKFCSRCGQRAIPPRPTLRELAGDAWHELVGFDGKLARTLRLLLARPGELTQAVLEGRRARYISPVRLYLLCSLLYFLLAGLVPTPDPQETTVDVGIGFASDERDPVDAVFAKAIATGLESLTVDERAMLEAEIASNPAWMRAVLRRIVSDYDALQGSVLATLPRALFVLIPLLALLIGLFYRGRHYPEHLYAALHLQSFVFVVLCAVTLSNYAQSLAVYLIAESIAAGWVVAYAVIALRRIYGGSWPGTVTKAICIAATYAVLWAATSFGVTLWVAAGG